MTAQRDLDGLIGTFLEDGPAELSPRLLGAIRDDIHRTDQRAFRRPWRTPSMPRSLLILVPIGALLLLLGALALGGGGRNSATPVPASPAASAAVVAPSPSGPSATPVGTPYPIAAGEAWIAYQSGGPDGVMLVRPDGTGSHVLFPADDGSQNQPDWSPDGSQLVFERDHAIGSQLWVINADGTGGRALTTFEDTCVGACPFTTTPRWSRDGRSIAYIETIVDGARPTSNAVKIVDVATGDIRTVYESTTDVLRGPSWSPDGKQLVISVESYPQLATSHVDGTAPTATTIALLDTTTPGAVPVPIPGVPAFAGRPDWSPDGRLIVFRTNPFINGVSADPTAGTTIATIAPSGGPVKTILTSPVGGPLLRSTNWTPDGAAINYSSLVVSSDTETLRIVDADGSNPRSATGDVETRGNEARLRPTP